MPMYSVVISIYGWSAKNIHTGKLLSGGYEELPQAVSLALGKLMSYSNNTLCVASTVPVPEHSEFSQWFEKQPRWPKQI